MPQENWKKLTWQRRTMVYLNNYCTLPLSDMCSPDGNFQKDFIESVWLRGVSDALGGSPNISRHMAYEEDAFQYSEGYLSARNFLKLNNLEKVTFPYEFADFYEKDIS